MTDGLTLQSRNYIYLRYYNKKDHIVTMLINKTYGKLSVIQLIQEVQKEILENESKIKNLREVRYDLTLEILIG